MAVPSTPPGLVDTLSPPTPPGNVYDFNTGLVPNMPSRALGPSQGMIEDAGSPDVSPENALPTTYPSSIFDSNDIMDPNVLDLISQGYAFPLNSWGTMPMAVLLGEASGNTHPEHTVPDSTIPETDTNTLNAVNQDDHLMTPLDFAAVFNPRGHQDHHMMAPDGFCPQCFNDAVNEVLVVSTSPNGP